MRRIVIDSIFGFIVLLLLFIAPLTVYGQSGATASSVTGNVADETGAVIPGVLVTARNLETNFTREATAGEDGSFLIPQLPPGNYELTAAADGFTTKTSRLNIVLGTTTLFNFVMNIGANTEVIEVRADAAISQGKTESSTNIDRGRIDNLPINRRDFMQFTLTSARVGPDRVPIQGAAATSGLSFNGQSARLNNITIDGLDNNDIASGSVRSTFGQDAVQEFQVVSDGYSAEFGRALGGIVNIVTRGGGNEHHGNLFFFDRNDSISSRNAFSTINPEYKQYQFGATLSGPIKRDRAFFFASFERLSIKQSNLVTIGDETVAAARRLGFPLRNGPVPLALGTTSILARADAKITPNDTLYVRYNFGGTYNGAFEPFESLTGDTSAGIQRLKDNAFAFNNTYLNIGLNLVNETRFLFNNRDQNVDPVDRGPAVSIVAPEGNVMFGRGTFLPQPRKIRTHQIVDNITLSRGNHQIKFGGDFVYVTTPVLELPLFPGGLTLFRPVNFALIAETPGLPEFSGLQAFDPALRTPVQIQFLKMLSGTLPGLFPGFPAGLHLENLSLPFVFLQGFLNGSPEVPSKLFSAFVQDDIKVRPNLLVKFGLRYDINRVRFVPNNNGNFSPRIALSYKPDRIKNLDLRASYGIFFAVQPLTGTSSLVNSTGSGALKVLVVPFPFSVIPFSLEGRRFPESTDIPPDVPFIRQLSQTYQFDSKLRNSYSQQASLGFDYQMGANTLVSINYQFLRGLKIFSQRNINTIVRSDPASPLQSAIFGRVDPSRGDVFQFEASFDSYYHGVTFSVNRRFSNNLGFLAHYTISKAIDNFADFRNDVEGAVPVNPMRTDLERALSLQDVRNRFVLSGVWGLDYTKNPLLKDFQISAIVTLESGRPYNLLAGQDLNGNGDNPASDRPLVGGVTIGRNAGIRPGFANVDLRVTRSISFGERVRFQGFVDVFNMFNRVNISEISNIFQPVSLLQFDLPPKDGGRFIAPKERFRNAFSPRQFQLGFKVTF